MVPPLKERYERCQRPREDGQSEHRQEYSNHRSDGATFRELHAPRRRRSGKIRVHEFAAIEDAREHEPLTLEVVPVNPIPDAADTDTEVPSVERDRGAILRGCQS